MEGWIRQTTGYTGPQALIVGTVSFLYALWVSPGSRNPGPPLGQHSPIDRDGDGHRARREDGPPYGSGDGPPVPGAGNVRTQRVTCGMRLEAISTGTTAVPAAGPGSPVRVRATHAEAKPSNTLPASARPADALAEFADQAFAVAEHGRLTELRLAALEARVEADLALGREAAIVGDLESLVDANPYRERFRAQLMLALYRAGRQAEALAVYADTRRLLIDELGIEPGEQLRELHGAVLAQDPGLRPVGSAWNGSAGTGQPG